MVKRKSENEHSSRVAYSAEGARDTSSPSTNVFARADVSTLASRRIVRPAGGQDIRSKKHRRQAHLRGLMKLNEKFAEWAEAAREKIESGPVPAVGDTSTPPLFFLEAVEDYVRQADALRERYVLTHGDVLTFGSGDCGQLGIPDEDGDALQEAMRPKLVRSLRDRKVIDLSLGGLHGVAIQEDGEVYTWGGNDEGQLGQYCFANPEGVSPPVGFPNFVNQISTAVVPSRVTGFFPSKSSSTYPHDYVTGTDEAIVMAATGDCHTICLSTTGNVYFFGCYKDGEGKPWRDPLPPDETRGEQERHIEDAYVAKYIHDYGGEKRSSEEETIEEEAKSKRNKTSPKGVQMWPIHVYRFPKKAKYIAAGAAFNAAHLVDGSIVTWGTDESGELGRPVGKIVDKATGNYDIEAVLNQHMRPLSPQFENPSVKKTVERLACGGWHLLVVARGDDASGLSVYSTGLNNYGQLGQGDSGPDTSRSILTKIKDLDGLNISHVAAGYHHSLCLDGSGRNLYAFGRGDSGQLGCTDELPEVGYCEDKPISIYLEYDKNARVQAEQPQVQSITCGDNHNMALTEGGELYTWGYGDTAALGHGKDVDEYRPKKVVFKKKPPPVVRRIAGGGQFSAIVVTTEE
mmetsp:Transcript_7349/g.21691  ORF Transcript_7349/g.21691 Transcript_7349/m.21691 type:complete len:629 (-) Transcript_7349:136-2022(-)|eukprot:CAMPEP_0113534288 /NCGR_PEP_ID=MMETSP0015_2-20120614/5081_1 /TAXON_ID=2838 /ORGANISM="Odontella" /LENGTH=628 /DNA_ID=CAMNT_0000433443 /DNA_START=118 /DNA_END=2004 /DNA_ORIENTATION=- /assembly_acc=CAM_ASM_000160